MSNANQVRPVTRLDPHHFDIADRIGFGSRCHSKHTVDRMLQHPAAGLRQVDQVVSTGSSQQDRVGVATTINRDVAAAHDDRVLSRTTLNHRTDIGRLQPVVTAATFQVVAATEQVITQGTTQLDRDHARHIRRCVQAVVTIAAGHLQGVTRFGTANLHGRRQPVDMHVTGQQIRGNRQVVAATVGSQQVDRVRGSIR